MIEIIEKIRLKLNASADEKTRTSGLRFFKEAVTLYGVKTSVTLSISRESYLEITDLPKNKIFGLCETLWKSGMLEESFIACNWSYAVRKNYQPADFLVLERWVDQYVKNWASCDTFCNHTVGTFVVMYPEYLQELKRWAKSPNLWMRRASAVSLIVPARNGQFLSEIFEIADILLIDKEDMVQKGYGWMLKAASKPYQRQVYDFVVKNKKKMPRTALRYAIEKMPPELRKKAMER